MFRKLYLVEQEINEQEIDERDNFVNESNVRIRRILINLANAGGFANSVDIVDKIMSEISPIIKRYSQDLK